MARAPREGSEEFVGEAPWHAEEELDDRAPRNSSEGRDAEVACGPAREPARGSSTGHVRSLRVAWREEARKELGKEGAPERSRGAPRGEPAESWWKGGRAAEPKKKSSTAELLRDR